MPKSVVMKDIAEELGISIVTVSKALAGKDGVGPELRKRIIETANRLGYHHAAQPKTEKDSKTIGVLVAHRFLGPNNGFYWDMYRHIMQRVSHYQGYTILEEVDHEQEQHCMLPNLLSGHKVDALIMLGQISAPYIRAIQKSCLPIILLDFYDRHVEMDEVLTDNIFGSYCITNHLIQKGHRHIGFVGSIRSTSSILDRYIGYYKALLEAELPRRDEWIIPDRNELGELFLDLPLPAQMPTAFVCNCDETAYRLLQTLNRKGLRVPEDVSIVGFDNYLFSTIANPQITTMEVDIPRMADVVVDCIMQKIEDPNLRVGRRMVESHIVSRKSVKSLVR